MQDIVDFEENEAHQAEAAKFKGLIQVDENFLINMAIANVKGWKDLWFDVKKIDIDKNGMMDITDLENLMKDYFPDHLEGKSLHYYFKQFNVSYDKNLVNYKPIKESVNKEVAQKLKDIRDGKMSSMSVTPSKEEAGVLNMDNLTKLNGYTRSRSTMSQVGGSIMSQRSVKSII